MPVLRMKKATLQKLDVDFYTRTDVVAVARDLLGKILLTNVEGELTAAIITETEAYAGVDDRASHAWGDRRTRRTEPMYAQGGTAYVYLCYGIHHLFNVVTSRQDDPQAVLIRAGISRAGTDRMLVRRGKDVVDEKLLGGPGSLACALGITTDLSGTSLLGDRIWIEDHGIKVPDEGVIIGPRVGIQYAREDVDRPYRFRVADLSGLSSR